MSREAVTFLAQCQGGNWDAHYLAFFECFNRQLFFEAHEVLEELWLQCRGTSRDLFYKGLIQVAGAFVHVQKDRPQPAKALLELGGANLRGYEPECDGLDVTGLVHSIDRWLEVVRRGEARQSLIMHEKPRIELASRPPAPGAKFPH